MHCNWCYITAACQKRVKKFTIHPFLVNVNVPILSKEGNQPPWPPCVHHSTTSLHG